MSFWRRLCAATLLATFIQAENDLAIETTPAPVATQPTDANPAFLPSATKEVDEQMEKALVHFEKGEWDEALEQLKRAHQRDPANLEVIEALGWLYLAKGEPEKSRFWFKQTLLFSTDKPHLLFGVGLSEYELKHPFEAASYFEKALEKDSRFAIAHYYLGQSREAMGHIASAIEAYQQTLKVDSKLVATRFSLAKLREKRQEWSLAWQNYSSITKANPTEPTAVKALERLQGKLPPSPPAKPSIAPIPDAPKGIVYPAPDTPDLPILRVGVGTSQSGAPLARTHLRWTAQERFRILGSSRGPVLTRGRGDTPWSIRLKGSRRLVAEIIGSNGTVMGRFSDRIFIRQEKARWRTYHLSWNGPAGPAEKELRGDLEIRVNRSLRTLTIINHIPVEDYLYGVIAAEMPPKWPLEALKTQAIISRTLVAFRTRYFKPHQKLGYDLCDDQHCQVYGGSGYESHKIRRAVNETHRMILTYEGRPAHTVFTANCGGHTQSGADAGWGDVPYWRATLDAAQTIPTPHTMRALYQWLLEKPDCYCNTTRYGTPAEFRWSSVVTADDLRQRLGTKRNVGDILSVTPLNRSVAGNVQSLLITGTQGHQYIKQEHMIRYLMGMAPVRSTQLIIRPVSRQGRPYAFLLFGGGWGHGVGLCQSGTAGRAEAGHKYPEILQAYYPGTQLIAWTGDPQRPPKRSQQLAKL